VFVVLCASISRSLLCLTDDSIKSDCDDKIETFFGKRHFSEFFGLVRTKLGHFWDRYFYGSLLSTGGVGSFRAFALWVILLCVLWEHAADRVLFLEA